MTPIKFTVFTSIKPSFLCKQFSLSDGQLEKTSLAQMVSGKAKIAEAYDLYGLSNLLDSLDSNQAVGWGVLANGAAESEITTANRENEGEAIARTRANFTFSNGPGVMMLDHDGTDGEPLEREALRDRLIQACPALASAPMLWRPSSSAGLLHPDGALLTGLHRHRLYIPVSDASKIPEAGERLIKLLWAAGMGWFRVGKAGQALSQCLVDSGVWQPERMDFAAPPILRDGIQRPAELAKVYGDATMQFDLSAIVCAEQDNAAAQTKRREARGAVESSCVDQRQKWLAELVPVISQKLHITELQATETLRRASEHLELTADFVLTTSDGYEISVGQLLGDKRRWHETRFADPLDPDKDLRVAYANLLALDGPYLYSHRHGGIRFRLSENSALAPTIRFPLLGSEELRSLPAMTWLIKGILPSSGIGAFYGESGSGKSFLAIDMAAAIAEGRKWFGHRVVSARVVYVCLEGEAGFRTRVLAWEKHNGRPIPDTFKAILETFKLNDKQDVEDLATVLLTKENTGALIILDTLNRATPGADENSSKDMGEIISNTKKLQQLVGGLVLLVTHTGKDRTKGIRGHSSLIAALDAAIQVTREGERREWINTKAKDGKDSLVHPFRLEVTALSIDEDGEPISSCVISTDQVESRKENLKQRTPAGGDALLAYGRAAVERGRLDSEGNFAGLHLEDWRPYFYQITTADEKSKRTYFSRGRNNLVERGELTVDNNIYRLAGAAAEILEGQFARELKVNETRNTPGTNAEQCTASRPTETEQPEHTALGSVPCFGVAIGVSNQKKRRWKKRGGPTVRRAAMTRTAELVRT